jgi:hypothetical protein
MFNQESSAAHTIPELWDITGYNGHVIVTKVYVVILNRTVSFVIFADLSLCFATETKWRSNLSYGTTKRWQQWRTVYQYVIRYYSISFLQ